MTSSTVGRHPNGSCASRRTNVPRGAPSQPQRRHHSSGSLTRQDRPGRLQSLPDHDQAQLGEACERGQIRSSEGSVRHVEVFRTVV